MDVMTWLKVNDVNEQLAESIHQQAQQIDNKGIQDSMVSVIKSKTRYDDTASSIFTENWTNLSAWAALSSLQVSSNKLYNTGVGGGSSGANHSFAIASGEKLRAVFKVNIPSLGTSGAILIGVSSDVAGTAPTIGSTNTVGIYIPITAASQIQSFNLGTRAATIENATVTEGTYIVTVTVDTNVISISAVKTDGTIEACYKSTRTGFNINNLHVFNSDNRGLSGASIDVMSARKGLETITPRAFAEGQEKSIIWTDDGVEAFRVYLPKDYDSRIPYPVAICFHGNGTDEAQWSINGNMKIMQKALIDAKYIVVTCGLIASKTTWGNSASTNAYALAYQYVKNHYAISSVVIYANSMGSIESLNALSENKIPCVAWVGTSPTYNLRNNYDNPTFTPVIKSAYGIASDGSDYDVKTNGRDPALMNPLKFRCIPMMILAAPDDTAVSKVENGDKLATSVTNTTLELLKIDVPSGGHSFPVTPYTTQIINFFNKYVSA